MTHQLPVETIKRLPAYLEDEVLLTLKNAVDYLEAWGSYVDDYFKSKHAFEADVAEVRGVIARVERVLAGNDTLSEYD